MFPVAAYISAVSVEEMRYGALRLLDGRRKTAILGAIELMVEDFGSRALPFGRKEAIVCGALRANARAAGNNVGIQDLMIAATAASGLVVATRNARDFDGLGVPVHNPFEEPTS